MVTYYIRFALTSNDGFGKIQAMKKNLVNRVIGSDYAPETTNKKLLLIFEDLLRGEFDYSLCFSSGDIEMGFTGVINGRHIYQEPIGKLLCNSIVFDFNIIGEKLTAIYEMDGKNFYEFVADSEFEYDAKCMTHKILKGEIKKIRQKTNAGGLVAR
jgi:hypothetical protein